MPLAPLDACNYLRRNTKCRRLKRYPSLHKRPEKSMLGKRKRGTGLAAKDCCAAPHYSRTDSFSPTATPPPAVTQEVPNPQRLALTDLNLRLLQAAMMAPSSTSPRRLSRSPTKSVLSATNEGSRKSAVNDEAKLRAYKIREIREETQELPEELQALLANIYELGSVADGSSSPRAQKIVDRHPLFKKMMEDDGSRATAHLLFLQPKLWDGEHELIGVACNHNLGRAFLPEMPSEIARNLGLLERPRPGQYT